MKLEEISKCFWVSSLPRVSRSEQGKIRPKYTRAITYPGILGSKLDENGRVRGSQNESDIEGGK